jgi:Helix-turn-helix domain
MNLELANALRALAEALPVGTPVPVPREVLLELLAGGGAAPIRATETVPADLTVAQLAARFGRKPSTVRGWLDRQLIPGAYRFQGREWRVPAASLAAFEESQRLGVISQSPSPSRGPRQRPVDLGAWRRASLAHSPQRDSV